MEPTIPIIDSHAHFFPESELATLAWVSPDVKSPIISQQSLEQYTMATQSCKLFLRGFVFVETDRSHEEGSWYYPLMEVEWMKRISLGTPRPGEGHGLERAHLCLAVVPWAPVPSGKQGMLEYTQLVEDRLGAAWKKVKGFRHLLQDQKHGVMLDELFIESLRWMGTFDICIDNSRGEDWQLQSCLQMMAKAHEGLCDNEKVRFIIDHICKPNMTILKTGRVKDHSCFKTWLEAIVSMSKFNNTYIKLSGCFSLIPKKIVEGLSADEIFHAIQPWLLHVLTTFTPSRVMFAADWPVCGINGGSKAWEKWRSIVQQLCQVSNLSTEDEAMVWSGTAIKAYGIRE